MKAFTDLGVEVAITELNIRLQEPETAENLAQQSSDYETTVGACVQVEECVGITVWDFYDPVSALPFLFSSSPLNSNSTTYFPNSSSISPNPFHTTSSPSCIINLASLSVLKLKDRKANRYHRQKKSC
jgi:GH35 family endo-1,4-beta-xylanase